MSSPTECQGKAYHTPSAAKLLECYRCHATLTAQWYEHIPVEVYSGTPLSALPTGDMGE